MTLQPSFFETVRIFDGGMGQELLKRGLNPEGTLWSAHALIHDTYHPLVIDTHKDFINAGAEIITTATFTSRKGRLQQNNCLELFEKINQTAVTLAQRARDAANKDVLIAGGLPNQKQTYSADLGDDLDEIKERFYSQACCLQEGIDFFFLDVMGSILECEIALDSVASLQKPVLVSVHVNDAGFLPSGETITQVAEKNTNRDWLGLMVACSSPKAYEAVQAQLQLLDFPYGFKLNGFKEIPAAYVVSSAQKWGDDGNPSAILGINEALRDVQVFYDYAKKFKQGGATLLGGCCEIGPEHIKAIAQLKG